jgi:O-acetylhomoserine (thiol)-lyase
MEKKYGFNTLSIHAGQQPDPATGSRSVPIYQTTSYVFEDAQHSSDLFNLSRSGNIYTRIMNPTTSVFEERMAALEGGIGALAVASGSSAITYSIMNLAAAGDQIVAASTLYGGTFNLFAHTLPNYGIVTVFANPDDPESFKNATNEKTKAWFVESIGNPGSNLVDLARLAELAHEQGIPLIVDNTFGTPWLIRPIEHGADIVVHSATKFIGGHGTTIGGVVIDAGRFDFSGGRFPLLSEPDPSYHGLRYAQDVGAAAYITRMRVSLLRDTGAAISPFNAWLLLQGLETLPLRVDRHVQNSEIIAAWLEKHPAVKWVSYPGLPDSRYHALAEKYFPKGAGSIFAFGLKGGREAAVRFIDRLELFSLLANVADAKSLVIHPASTTHSQLSEEELAASGITQDMVRLSIGLEDAEDLLTDLEQALAGL